MLKITDPKFVYVSAVLTDIRILFEKERERLALAAKAEQEQLSAEDLHPDLPAMLDRDDFEARR